MTSSAKGHPSPNISDTSRVDRANRAPPSFRELARATTRTITSLAALVEANTAFEQLQQRSLAPAPESSAKPLVLVLPSEVADATQNLTAALRDATEALQLLAELAHRSNEVVDRPFDLLGFGRCVPLEADLSAAGTTGGLLRDVDGDLLGAPRALDADVPVHGSSLSRGVISSPPRGTEKESRLYSTKRVRQADGEAKGPLDSASPEPPAPRQRQEEPKP